MNSYAETFSNQWFSATFTWAEGLLVGVDLSAGVKAPTAPQSPFGPELERIVTQYAHLDADQWPDLPLDRRGLTPFTWNVLENLRRHTPRGRFTTYGALASLCGSPGRHGPWAASWPEIPGRWSIPATGSWPATWALAGSDPEPH